MQVHISSSELPNFQPAEQMKNVCMYVYMYVLLKIGATLAIFQLFGKQPVAIERSKISQRDSELTRSAIFREQLAIPSFPHPFDIFNLPKTFPN